MELVQVINGVERCVEAARFAYDEGDSGLAKDELAEAAGLVQREIGDLNEVHEDSAGKEEAPEEDNPSD